MLDFHAPVFGKALPCQTERGEQSRLFFIREPKGHINKETTMTQAIELSVSPVQCKRTLTIVFEVSR